MYTVYESVEKVNDSDVSVFGRDIAIGNFNLNIEVGTSGLPKTKKSASQAKTSLKIVTNDENIEIFTSTAGDIGIKFEAVGNDELTGLLKALKFATKVLEDKINSVED